MPDAKNAARKTSWPFQIAMFLVGALSVFLANLFFGTVIVDLLGFDVHKAIIVVNCISLLTTSLISLEMFSKTRPLALSYFLGSFLTGLLPILIFGFLLYI